MEQEAEGKVVVFKGIGLKEGVSLCFSLTSQGQERDVVKSKEEQQWSKGPFLMFLISARQVQATVLGLLAAVVVLLLGAVSRGELDFAKVELLCASSIITAFLASFALGELCPNPSTLPPPGWPPYSSSQSSTLSSLCFQFQKLEH